MQQKSKHFTAKRTKLSLLIDAYGITNFYVAWRLGLTASYVAGIANLTKRPSKKTLARLAELFDIRNASPETLLEQVSSETYSRAVKAYLGLS